MRRSLGILAAILLALGLLVPAALAAPGAPGGAGHGLVVPTNRGLVQGKSGRGHRPVARHPLRGAAGGRAALGGAPAGAALGRNQAGHQLRRPVRAAGQRQRPPGGQRGLPVPERLRPAGRATGRAARAGDDPRRRADHRRGRPARRVADRQHRPHRRRLDQLPARPVRLPEPARPRHVGADRERQLRPARPGEPRCAGCSATSPRSAGTRARSPSTASRRAAGRSAR